MSEIQAEPMDSDRFRDLPPDMVLMKMENESIQAMATAKPRDLVKVFESIQTQLENFPSFCKKAIFNKPVGKDRETGEMKYARGLSIRTAEALAEAYGYNRVSCAVIESPDNDDTVSIQATFVDYANGRIWQDSTIVSKTYTTYRGGKQRHNDDRFYNVVVKAEKSKLIREVILRSVPPGLKTEIEERAETLIDDFLDDATIDKLITTFADKGVTAGMLSDKFGKKLEDLTKDDRKTLLGLWNAIDQEETTVAEAFGKGSGSAPVNAKASILDNGPSDSEDPAPPLTVKGLAAEIAAKAKAKDGDGLFSVLEKVEALDCTDAEREKLSKAVSSALDKIEAEK